MITSKRKTGDLGESIAAKYLKSRGFLVLHRNYLKPHGEIDIVCSKGGEVHFVEVKSISCEIPDKVVAHEKVSHVTGDWNPAERVDKRKLKRLVRTAGTYLREHRLDLEWQIDVALVYMDHKHKCARVEILEAVTVNE